MVQIGLICNLIKKLKNILIFFSNRQSVFFSTYLDTKMLVQTKLINFQIAVVFFNQWHKFCHGNGRIKKAVEYERTSQHVWRNFSEGDKKRVEKGRATKKAAQDQQYLPQADASHEISISIQPTRSPRP